MVRIRSDKIYESYFLIRLWVAALIVALPASAASDSPQTFTAQGRFLNAAGTAPLTSIVDLKFGIYNPAGDCLLYEETQTAIDLSLTDGMFAVDIGSVTGATKRTASDPGKSMAEIFANTGTQLRAAGANCTAGYTPTSGDVRTLRVTVTPQGEAAFTMSPDQVIDSAPQAMVAETLQGIGPSGFLQPNAGSNLSQTTLQQLTSSVDASTLHHHASLYASKSGDTMTGALNLPSNGLAVGTTQLVVSGGSVGIGTTTPASKLHVGVAPTASANYGTLSLGSGAFNGSTAGFFTGSTSGTSLAVNEATGFAGNLIDLQTNGVSKFRIMNGGDLNLGTTAYATRSIWLTTGNQAKLELNASGVGQEHQAARLMMGGHNGFGANFHVYYGSSADVNNGDFRVYDYHGSTTATERFRINNVGNVGIGTTAPAAPLHIPAKSSSVNTSSMILGDDIAMNTGATRTRLQLGNSSGISEFLVGQDATHGLLFNWTYDATAGNAVGKLETYGGNNPLVLQGAGGNVGIGTTVPDQPLTVNGRIAVKNGATTVGVFGANSDNVNTSFTRNAYESAGSWNRISTSDYSVLSQLYGSGTSSEFQIYTSAPAANPISNWTKQFSVKNDGTGYFAGNVGIGTSTPQDKLDVNGNIRVAKNSAQPYACDAAHDAVLALTSGYRHCVCKGGSATWVFTSDGTTTCTW